MSFKAEFETVDLILNSKCITKGVDGFALSLIKAERQMRKLFTFLIYQNPKLQNQYNDLRNTLASNRSVYFLGFIKGIEAMYPIKIQDLIGKDYEILMGNLSTYIDDRNKIFHGQLTIKRLGTEEFIQRIEDIRKWCRLMSESAIKEFGYDGFGRNSMQKSEKNIYSKYLIRIESIDEYKAFIKRYMVKGFTEEEIKKSNASYYQINEQELFRGFQLCLVNAKSQFDAAIKIKSDKVNMGLANSLLILSAEECIKGFVLLAIHFNVPVPFLIKPIFASHDAKHVRGKELNAFVRKLSLSLGLFSSKRNEQVKSFIGLVIDTIADDNASEVDWWDAANAAKNDGLYIRQSKGRFRSPVEFGEKSFEMSREIVNRFISLLDKANELMKDVPRAGLSQMRGGAKA